MKFKDIENQNWYFLGGRPLAESLNILTSKVRDICEIRFDRLDLENLVFILNYDFSYIQACSSLADICARMIFEGETQWNLEVAKGYSCDRDKDFISMFR